MLGMNRISWMQLWSGPEFVGGSRLAGGRVHGGHRAPSSTRTRGKRRRGKEALMQGLTFLDDPLSKRLGKLLFGLRACGGG